jgi:hypothetical protein
VDLIPTRQLISTGMRSSGADELGELIFGSRFIDS